MKSHQPSRGTQRQFSGKYLFGRRYEIYNFRSICCKISCLPASLRIFEHLQIGINYPFLTDLDPKKGHLEFSGAFSWLKFSRRKLFILIIFGSLDFQLGNPNRWKVSREKNMPISTDWILKYVQQCYVKCFWTISSMGAPGQGSTITALLLAADAKFLSQK